MTGAPRLEIRLLGRFAVLLDGAEIPTAAFGGRKVRTLLRILATRRGSVVSYDALTEMLWPDQPPASPAANLQVLVNRARKALGDASIVLTSTGGYALAGGPACSVDAERFVASAESATTLAELRSALDGWAGEPLAEDAYADWAGDFRARLARVRQDALERAAQLATGAGEHAPAVEYASAAVEAEPLREAAALALVRALAAAGDTAAALTRYDDYRRTLADELGIDPSAEAAALHLQLLRGPASSSSAVTTPRRRQSVGFGELPFVGRAADLRSAVSVLAAAKQAGRGATVLVDGPSGSGKSRMLRALAAQIPLTVARAYAPEQAEPWSLVRTLLREILAQDITHRDSLPAALSAALVSLLPELDGGDGVSVDAQSRRALVQEAALRLLAASGQVVAVDDVQWIDPTSLTVIETASARLPDLRLVLAYRPEEIADGSDIAAALSRVRADLTLNLRGLSQESIVDLVADDELAAALARHTDRTPLAIGEVLRGLTDEGLIARGVDGRWRSTPEARPARRAAELGRQGQRHAIALRAAHMPPAPRQLLELISLLSREVAVADLAGATHSSEADVLDRLATLFRAGLVRLGDFGWTTSHDMVTETIASGLDDVTRARRHAMLATALEAEHADAAELARHWLASGDSVRAATAFARSAQDALESFSHHEAANLAEAGLAVRPAPMTAAELHETRAQARARLGDFAGARDDLRAALAAQGAGPARARVLGRLAMLASGADDIVRAAELAELAVVEAGRDPAAQAQALEIASVLDMNLDRTERAAERSAEALRLYHQLGDANGIARILDARAMATFLDGDVRGGAAALQKAADLFEDSGDLIRVVTPRSTSGHALVFAGRSAEGLIAASAALDLARTLGHPEGQTYAHWHCAEALAALNRPAEALTEATAALAIATELGHRGWSATAWRAVGIAHESGGDLNEALRAFLESLDLSDNLGLFASWAAARAASTLVALGEFERARALVDRALAEGPQLAGYEARLAQVELAAATGDAHAAKLARMALDLAHAGGVAQGCDRLEALVVS